MPSAKPLCLGCRHYYVTWDKAFPYGCKAMGFKSRSVPCLVTRNASGLECLSFAARAAKPAGMSEPGNG